MICVPGDDVAPLQDGLMRGHGTYSNKNQLVSCGSGRIERVNKLASVRPVRGRYTGSVGDLVVGEIVEVAHRSWKVDVGSTRKATLAITSVTLPDDAQRVRTHVAATAELRGQHSRRAAEDPRSTRHVPSASHDAPPAAPPAP